MTYPISGDSWNGRLDRGWRIETPSIDDLDRAIDRLDAETHTIMTVEGAGEAHLTIGGGAGRYVVYATFDNEAFWNLVRPDAATGVVMVNAGGQEGGDRPDRGFIGHGRSAGEPAVRGRGMQPLRHERARARAASVSGMRGSTLIGIECWTSKVG